MVAIAPRRKPYYGWVIVGVGVAAQFLIGVSALAYSTYLVPLGQEFGWSRTALAGPRSLTQVEAALLGPAQGHLIDRIGPRPVFVAGVLLLGLGMVLFGLIENIWHYYAVNLVMGLGASLCGLLVVATVVNSWFRRKRTMAMAITTIGLSLGGIVAVPIVVWIQATMGWREATIASGIAVWAIGLPAAIFMRRNPEEMGLLPDGDTPEEAAATAAQGDRAGGGGRIDFSLREAMGASAFWCVGLGSGLYILIQTAIFVHIFLHLEQGVGLSRASAVAAFTVLNVVNIAGRLAGGFLGDRYPKHLLLGAGSLGSAIALLLVGFASSIVPVLVFAVIFGLCWGMRVPLVNSIAGDYFGRTSYGKILGALQLISAPLGIVGPVLAGLGADIQGDYRGVFAVFFVLMAVSAALYFLVRPPTIPARLRAETEPPAQTAHRE